MGDVGTTKVFEDDKVIVWEFRLAPGESTPLHTHEHNYMFYVLDGASLEVFDADAKPVTEFDPKAGEVWSFRCEDNELVSTDEKAYRVPATHSARNIGTTPYREMLVETK